MPTSMAASSQFLGPTVWIYWFAHQFVLFLLTYSLLSGGSMKQIIKSGAMIAAAAAALALSGAASAATTSISAGDSVHCAGINSCKGTSECATAENSCKGQNSCKGHGFVGAKASECLKKGGKIINLDK
jgi:hypothetical protein